MRHNSDGSGEAMGGDVRPPSLALKLGPPPGLPPPRAIRKVCTLVHLLTLNDMSVSKVS